MNRREFITLLGGAAIGPRRGASAQTAPRVYRVGLLNSGAPLTDTTDNGAAFIQGLARLGYVEGRNLLVERRGAEWQPNRLPLLVAELEAIKVDVIVTITYPAALAAKQGTKLPVVVYGAGDPVGTGLVDGLARPGGNLTGISDVAAELSPKRLELLKDFAPTLRSVAMLWNASDLGMTMRYQASEAAAQKLGINVHPLGVREPDDFKDAFAAMVRNRPDGILMVSDALTNLNRRRVFEFATANRLPAIFEVAALVRDGGLMSYGPDSDESFGRVAALVDRILKGTRPDALPFEQPTRFRLVINLKAAKALGLDAPPNLLARADEVIE